MTGLWRSHAFPSLARLRELHARALDGLGEDGAPTAVAAAQHEDACRAAYARGLADGRTQGEDTARSCIDAELAALATPLEELIDTMTRMRESQREAMREEMLALLEQVARQVIRAELALRPEHLLAHVEEALATLPAEETTVEIRLAPEPYRRLLEQAPELATRWRLRMDERLDPDECRIHAGERELDAGCGQRLAACMQQLRGAARHDSAPK